MNEFGGIFNFRNSIGDNRNSRENVIVGGITVERFGKVHIINFFVRLYYDIDIFAKITLSIRFLNIGYKKHCQSKETILQDVCLNQQNVHANADWKQNSYIKFEYLFFILSNRKHFIPNEDDKKLLELLEYDSD